MYMKTNIGLILSVPIKLFCCNIFTFSFGLLAMDSKRCSVYTLIIVSFVCIFASNIKHIMISEPNETKSIYESLG